MMKTRSGRGIAYVTMVAMLVLSVAGNVSHTYHINPAPSGRQVTYAVIWPLMVWAGVELFVRVPWRDVLTHRLVRWGGLTLVAFIAALVSYRHLRGLLVADGEEWTVYTFGPLAVDGLMLMSTLALLLTRRLPEQEPEEAPAPLDLDEVLKRWKIEADDQINLYADEPELRTSGGGKSAHTTAMVNDAIEAGASVLTAIETKERKPRAGKPEQEKAVRLMLDGQRQEAVNAGLMGDSTMRRYEKAMRTLRDNPMADIDTDKEKVRPELINIIRDEMNRERVR